MAAKKQPKKAANPEPKKAPKNVAPKPATPAPIPSTEDSAPTSAPTNEPSGAPVAARRQHGVVEYVKPNGKVRRAAVVSIDPNGLAHLRLQDGTELTGIPRAKSAQQTSAWRPEGDNAYE